MSAVQTLGIGLAILDIPVTLAALWAQVTMPTALWERRTLTAAAVALWCLALALTLAGLVSACVR